uniref:Uncharacterized protein n=1 Tax=Pseudo-nitzschia australis TaxID=44445 RepID=A0A7S4A955_9STRA|mmetsp:Transcript_25324/g.55507  ORF Transcript_25324/g.55507 Transcript_25324/m.55507 type:complete len:334 (+) Transcript_25324:219-1220(+)
MAVTNILHERFLSGIPSIVLLLVIFQTINICGAVGTSTSTTIQSGTAKEENFKNPLGRLLVTRLVSWKRTNPKFLRKLADGAENSSEFETRKAEFGPGADWSCTTPENDDYDSCTLSGTGCSWCPLGSSVGVCLRTSQADVVNALENDHLLHLKCYDNEDEVIDESATEFWDEAASCLPHGAGDCQGQHGSGDHTCTWCTVNEPSMGFCLSQSLRNNLIIAQALEDFDEDVSTGDQIRLDEIVHCDNDDDKSKNSANIWSQHCGWAAIETDQDEANCLSTKDQRCVVQGNPFPGLLGSKGGKHCVTVQQQQAMLWTIYLLRDMGWEDEMSSFQ